jgi:glycosyltransferase involved in cell wall biosynthesis
MSVSNFPNVSLLITHFNRPDSLRRLLEKFSMLSCHFGEIIVSDDCSKADNLSKLIKLRDEFGFTLVTSPVNKGLGNNLNKGQDRVSKPYTLYIQEDFIPKADFVSHFSDALNLMDKYDEMDIARFYGYVVYPYSTKFEKGFRTMDFKMWYPGYLKFYVYSDHPHLRRSNFFNKFGRYKEGVNADVTEYSMCLSFIKNGGHGFFYPKISDLFDQVNDAEEPSTANFRKNWKLSSNIAVRLLRQIYLQYKTCKYHKDLLLFKKHDA